MDWIDLMLRQLADPFRIGLIVALLVTAARTRNMTGTIVPLAAGIVFVAVIIPMTITPPGAGQAAWQLIAAGIVSNAILVALGLAGWTLVQRFRSYTSCGSNFRIEVRRSFMSNGFSTMSSAPCCNPLARSAPEPRAVIIRIRTVPSAGSSRTRRQIS